MIIQQPEQIDTETLRDIAADMRGELDRVEEQMAELTTEHKRAVALKQIFGVDPITRDRFNPLHAPEFEQETTAAAEEPGALGKHAPENLGAVRAAIIGQGRLERERVALQQGQRRRWHVRHDADHDVDPSFERAWQGCEQIALVGLHSVRGRAGYRTLVDVGRDNARAWPGRGQGPGDCSSPGADIDRRAGRRQPIDGPTRHRLALPPRNVNTGIDANLHPAERDAPGNPGQWLAGQPALDERAEELDITSGAGEKLVGLLLRGDKPGAREQRRERLEVKR